MPGGSAQHPVHLHTWPVAPPVQAPVDTYALSTLSGNGLINNVKFGSTVGCWDKLQISNE
jgi:hypothetical protein